MNDSILLSIKKLMGITKSDTNFDTDLIIHINSVFSILHQLGVGPVDGYKIEDSSNEWNEFIDDEDKLDSVKTYVYLKVKSVFDPPLNGALMESFKETIKELEWRLNVTGESIK